MTNVLILAFAILAVLDVTATFRALKVPGTYESNFAGSDPLVMWLIKVGGMALMIYCLLARATGLLDLARWAVIALLFGRGIYAVVNNLRIVRGA
jgi:hypothetical protein